LIYRIRQCGLAINESDAIHGDLSMQSNESDGIAAFLTGAIPDGTSSSKVAEAVSLAFHGIDQALAPIIGKRGVAALYKRTLHLAGGTHAWLAAIEEGVPNAMDVTLLKGKLHEQTAADAAAAGTLLVQTFHEMLTVLIGPSLTQQLLRPVWAAFLSGPSAKDTTT
jgi:hypothetical protein